MPLYNIIENLIKLIFGPKKSELIFWYIYNRKDADESVTTLVDKNGNPLNIDNPSELFDLINSINDDDIKVDDVKDDEEEEDEDE